MAEGADIVSKAGYELWIMVTKVKGNGIPLWHCKPDITMVKSSNVKIMNER